MRAPSGCSAPTCLTNDHAMWAIVGPCYLSILRKTVSRQLSKLNPNNLQRCMRNCLSLIYHVMSPAHTQQTCMGMTFGFARCRMLQLHEEVINTTPAQNK